MIAEKHSREKLIWKFISRFVEKGWDFVHEIQSSTNVYCLVVVLINAIIRLWVIEFQAKILKPVLWFPSCFYIYNLFLFLLFVMSRWNEMRIFIHRFLLCVWKNVPVSFLLYIPYRVCSVFQFSLLIDMNLGNFWELSITTFRRLQ